MRADAQFAVVEAVIKGLNKWIEIHGKTPQQDVGLPTGILPPRCLLLVTGTGEETVRIRSGELGFKAHAKESRGLCFKDIAEARADQHIFQDPMIKQKVIKLVVDISSKALDNHPAYALKVLEHILMTRLPDQPQYPVYAEAVRELHGLASHELRRLAIRYADYFSTFYDLLEPKIREITLANGADFHFTDHHATRQQP